MKKYVFLIVGLFLVSSQSLSAAAAGESSFLDGYKAEEVNRSNVPYFFEPFSRAFVGYTKYERRKGGESGAEDRGVGCAALVLELVGTADKDLWQDRLDDSIRKLTTEDFQYPIPGHPAGPGAVLRLIHRVNARDITVAKILYEIAYRALDDAGERIATTYESLKTTVVRDLLGVLPDMKDSERDLWAFLMAMKQEAWPINPATGSPSRDLDLLVGMFKDLITAYRAS